MEKVIILFVLNAHFFTQKVTEITNFKKQTSVDIQKRLEFLSSSVVLFICNKFPGAGCYRYLCPPPPPPRIQGDTVIVSFLARNAPAAGSASWHTTCCCPLSIPQPLPQYRIFFLKNVVLVLSKRAEERLLSQIKNRHRYQGNRASLYCFGANSGGDANKCWKGWLLEKRDAVPED